MTKREQNSSHLSKPAASQTDRHLLDVFLLLGELPCQACFGLGHAVSALRLRGDTKSLPWARLLGCGAHLAVALGMIVLGLWHG